MFPIIGLLCAHGTAQLLQFSMLGYWLAFPTILVIIERVVRIINGFIKISAELEVLDEDTIAISVTIPDKRIWRYKAGQYILLQVPQVSFFEWHPFTISACIGNEMQVHIKTDGDWTGLVRALGTDLKYVGVDGPFGAPAQRFYDFDQSIVLGSGIGVTPFSGILTDLQVHEESATKRARSHGRLTSNLMQVTVPRRPRTKASSQTTIGDLEKDSVAKDDIVQAESQSALARILRDRPRGRSCQPAHHRRVDFIWIVKNKNYLLWFSDLLNTLARPLNASNGHLGPAQSPHLDLRITTYVTQKRNEISTHVFRWLLEMHRTKDHPESPLTGLINPTHFGRPNLAKIMDEHYESMLKSLKNGDVSRNQRKVGVFFCGAPVIGYELADRCQLLSARGRQDGSRLEYHFQMEVFN